MLTVAGDIHPYTVGAHETFVFRSTWLKKGFDAVNRDPTVFSREDAIVVLGVGKNMVRSIRFWCLATQIVEEHQEPGGKKRLQVTDLGKRLLDDYGYDPYLEDIGSLWLLHWLLATNVQRASAWYHIFSGYTSPQFTRKQLLSHLQRVVERQEQRIAPASLERDADCFIRTYTAHREPHVLPEVALECPLTELNLIQSSDEPGWFQFHIGAKETLPVEVFGYALLTFAATRLHRYHQLSLYDCLYEPGSPGQVFRLDEVSLIDLVEQLLPISHGMMDLGEIAGMTYLFFKEGALSELAQLGDSLLDAYYSTPQEKDR